MNISIRHIEHFIAVAEELHFRRAAQIANVAQPALSRSVQALENELGIQLLARNNRNVKLTAAGEEFLAGSTQIIKSIDALVNSTLRANKTQFGGINVGYTYSALDGKLRQFISEFEAKHPSIIINPAAGSATDQLEQLHREKLDFCFITGCDIQKTINELDSVVVQEDAFSVIVNENHRHAGKQTISVDELNAERIILSSTQVYSKFNQKVRLILNTAQVNPVIDYVDQNQLGILGLVTLGRGICIANAGFGAVYTDGLKTLRLTGIDDKLPTLMIWRKVIKSDPAALFRDFVLNSLKAPHSADSAQTTTQPETMIE